MEKIGLASWNVNGWKKSCEIIKRNDDDLLLFLKKLDIDILCLQETKTNESFIENDCNLLEADSNMYESYWSCCKKKKGEKTHKGYSGLATYVKNENKIICSTNKVFDDFSFFNKYIKKENLLIKKKSEIDKTSISFFLLLNDNKEIYNDQNIKCDKNNEQIKINNNNNNNNTNISVSVSVSEFFNEGRILITMHKHFIIVNIYAPYSGHNYERLDYKIRFFHAVRAKMLQLRIVTGLPIILLGDFNISYRNKDIYYLNNIINLDILLKNIDNIDLKEDIKMQILKNIPLIINTLKDKNNFIIKKYKTQNNELYNLYLKFDDTHVKFIGNNFSSLEEIFYFFSLDPVYVDDKYKDYPYEYYFVVNRVSDDLQDICNININGNHHGSNNNKNDDHNNSSNNKNDDHHNSSNNKKNDDHHNCSNNKKNDDHHNSSNNKNDDHHNSSNNKNDDHHNSSNNKNDDHHNSSNNKNDDHINSNNQCCNFKDENENEENTIKISCHNKYMQNDIKDENFLKKNIEKEDNEIVTRHKNNVEHKELLKRYENFFINNEKIFESITNNTTTTTNNNNNNNNSEDIEYYFLKKDKNIKYNNDEMNKNERDKKILNCKKILCKYKYKNNMNGQYLVKNTNCIYLKHLNDIFISLNIILSEHDLLNIANSIGMTSSPLYCVDIIKNLIYEDNMIDTFSFFHPNINGKFTCWDTYRQCRVHNEGSRIDYIFMDYILYEQFIKRNTYLYESPTILNDELYEMLKQKKKKKNSLNYDDINSFESNQYYANYFNKIKTKQKYFLSNDNINDTLKKKKKQEKDEEYDEQKLEDHILDTEFYNFQFNISTYIGFIYTSPKLSDHIAIKCTFIKNYNKKNKIIIKLCSSRFNIILNYLCSSIHQYIMYLPLFLINPSLFSLTTYTLLDHVHLYDGVCPNILNTQPHKKTNKITQYFTIKKKK
ncbi:exodeoxyribonuclease III, putative [Plasmodium sp. gorilla clade G2]|uniref:exodeoxyribonuclease III, putative n=1 Tax=Plasmodium sp. gorilla clade G2 TaxID=880535 RepID=UPI000D210162|nr:exodeoxyribonuclease III, putative [Plasmodium sp. gorilla clade G2]SOV19096.1 exodeoxyribonuclease III, putative [Plasmodium sp. gorilla clade G2]